MSARATRGRSLSRRRGRQAAANSAAAAAPSHAAMKQQLAADLTRTPAPGTQKTHSAAFVPFLHAVHGTKEYLPQRAALSDLMGRDADGTPHWDRLVAMHKAEARGKPTVGRKPRGYIGADDQERRLDRAPGTRQLLEQHIRDTFPLRTDVAAGAPSAARPADPASRSRASSVSSTASNPAVQPSTLPSAAVRPRSGSLGSAASTASPAAVRPRSGSLGSAASTASPAAVRPRSGSLASAASTASPAAVRPRSGSLASAASTASPAAVRPRSGSLASAASAPAATLASQTRSAPTVASAASVTAAGPLSSTGTRRRNPNARGRRTRRFAGPPSSQCPAFTFLSGADDFGDRQPVVQSPASALKDRWIAFAEPVLQAAGAEGTVGAADDRMVSAASGGTIAMLGAMDNGPVMLPELRPGELVTSFPDPPVVGYQLSSPAPTSGFAGTYLEQLSLLQGSWYRPGPVAAPPPGLTSTASGCWGGAGSPRAHVLFARGNVALYCARLATYVGRRLRPAIASAPTRDEMGIVAGAIAFVAPAVGQRGMVAVRQLIAASVAVLFGVSAPPPGAYYRAAIGPALDQYTTAAPSAIASAGAWARGSLDGLLGRPAIRGTPGEPLVRALLALRQGLTTRQFSSTSPSSLGEFYAILSACTGQALIAALATQEWSTGLDIDLHHLAEEESGGQPFVVDPGARQEAQDTLAAAAEGAFAGRPASPIRDAAKTALSGARAAVAGAAGAVGSALGALGRPLGTGWIAFTPSGSIKTVPQGEEVAAPVVSVTVSYTDEAGWVSDPGGQTCSEVAEGAENAEQLAERCQAEGEIRVVTADGPTGSAVGRATASQACPRSCLTAIPPTVRTAEVTSALGPGTGWDRRATREQYLRAPDVFPPAFQPGRRPSVDADSDDSDGSQS